MKDDVLIIFTVLIVALAAYFLVAKGVPIIPTSPQLMLRRAP